MAGVKSRAARPITADYLDRVALAYLQRFAASSESLRRVLLRRVDRSARETGEDPAEGQTLVQALIARYQRSGLLDDRLYAEAKVHSLRRRGDSHRSIQAKLAAKGIGRELAGSALAAADEGSPAAETAAALALARRRGLGPFRRQNREAYRQKDLAALARAGFSYDVAQKVVEAADPEQALDPN